jgi:hypothetical protein
LKRVGSLSLKLPFLAHEATKNKAMKKVKKFFIVLKFIKVLILIFL